MRKQNPSPKIKYIQSLFASEDSILKKITHKLRKENRHIQISPEDARLLQFLVKLGNINTIVEIGTLDGYSGISMARELPSKGHIYTIEKDDRAVRNATKNFKEAGLEEKITILHGEALEMLEQITDKSPFDMVFIDADKALYSKYLDWAEKNIRKGGIIVGDNTFLFGQVYTKDKTKIKNIDAWLAMQNFNKRLANNNKYLSTMIPCEEGITIAIKNF